VDGTEQGTFLVLIGLADVEDNCTVGNRCRSALGVNFGNLRLCSGEKVAKRCHGEKPTNQVGYRVGVWCNQPIDKTIPTAHRTSDVFELEPSSGSTLVSVPP
jgi:hypothetical protein